MAKRKREEKASKKIVVTGDVTIDRLEITTPPFPSDNKESNNVYNWQIYPRTLRFTRPGGALLLANFLRSATNTDVLSPELKNIERVSSEKIVHSFVSLGKFPYSAEKKDEKNFVYRVKQFKGFAGPDKGNPTFLSVKDDDPNADIVVLDDAGNGFREASAVWPEALKAGKEPIVLIKMSSPIAKGSLWEEVRKNHAKQMVVVITAEALRHEGAKISRRLSWERTAKDFVWQMACNPSFFALNSCAYLIVRFGLEGAILYERGEGIVESKLFFDPKIGEDGFNDLYPGGVVGVGCAFVAAITAQIERHGDKGLKKGIEEGIRKGLLSARRLYKLGFGKDLSRLDYPVPEIFQPLGESEPFIADVIIPEPETSNQPDPKFWCILDDQTQAGLETVAYNYVLNGSDPEMDRIPIGQFHNLRTFDRSEIESFRSIRNLIGEYLDSPEVNCPLSIAVFGSPGSGKSFGVTEVAESVAPGRLEKIEFNLSQFNLIEELTTAFHRVRDISLGGKIPIVFFDEFDTEFKGKLGWFKYFLAPMQDGKFRDEETTHHIGRAIFIFAGGTCNTYAEFCREEGALKKRNESSKEKKSPKKVNLDGVTQEEFKSAKGPDFISRLRGYVNIKGPNPASENDRLYMNRRALLLRYLLKKNANHLFDDRDKCRIDPGILRAMIKIPKYKHGVRSMLAIIEMSMLAGRKSFEQAALPSPEQLELHVDAEMFFRLVVRDVILGGAREELAIAIHDKFRQDHRKDKATDDPGMALWKKLMIDFKESNREQADHIPVKLKAIGCDFAPVKDRKPVLIEFTDEEIGIMAEMEHERFVAERYLKGWSFGSGPKKIIKKTDPYLVKWKDLPEKIKGYNRQAVRAIPELLARTGFEIYRQKSSIQRRKASSEAEERPKPKSVGLSKNWEKGKVREALAKAVHEKYRQDHKHDRTADGPAMAPWEDLIEDFKESCRQQADHIPDKLRAVGYDFVPVKGKKPKLKKFRRDEIENMAEMEHERFVEERLLKGWSLGPRDPKKKTSPFLVEWKDLPEEIKEFDRKIVWAIPELLAKARYEICRLKKK